MAVLLNQVRLVAAQKSILERERQMLVERKVAFNQNASNPESWWIHCPPQNHLQRFCSAMKIFKGKKGRNLS